jgi:pimeloyl-ACP methyl ester carboxylesterase
LNHSEKTMKTQTLHVIALTPAKDKPDGVLRLEYRGIADHVSQWALVWPNEKSKDWAVVIHGHGSRGDQLFTRPDVRDLWLPAIRERGLNLITPDLRANAWMSPHAAEDMHALVNWLRHHYHAQRCVFASGSMGGTSNLIYAALHPKDAAGVVALCPATDLSNYYNWCRANCKPGDIVDQIANAIRDAYAGEPLAHPAIYRTHSALANADKLTMPTWVCHSTGDVIIPVDEPRRLAAAMKKNKNFAYEEIEGGHHDSSLPRFVEGLDWVLARM